MRKHRMSKVVQQVVRVFFQNCRFASSIMKKFTHCLSWKWRYCCIPDGSWSQNSSRTFQGMRKNVTLQQKKSHHIVTDQRWIDKDSWSSWRKVKTIFHNLFPCPKLGYFLMLLHRPYVGCTRVHMIMAYQLFIFWMLFPCLIKNSPKKICIPTIINCFCAEANTSSLSLVKLNIYT